MATDRLPLAIAALKRGDQAAASRLLQSILAENPRHEQAWIWACEAAATPEERIDCLQHLLDLNPAHGGARQYLAQLERTLPPRVSPPSRLPADAPVLPPELPVSQAAAAQAQPISPAPATFRLGDLIAAPLGCLLQLSPLHGLLAIVVVGLAIGAYYFNANSDFFGLTDPHLDQLAISPSFDTFQSATTRWQITFEKPGPSRFAGTVRHASPIHEVNLQVLTHDILVTSGDYALPAQVGTAVFMHHFFWRALSNAQPAGAINLLHTVPASEAIYRQLLAVQPWEKVAISGREILDIQIYDAQGRNLGAWTDTGCNSLVVQSVEITP
jgi:hypothetical protein